MKGRGAPSCKTKVDLRISTELTFHHLSCVLLVKSKSEVLGEGEMSAEGHEQQEAVSGEPPLESVYHKQLLCNGKEYILWSLL